MTDDAKKEDGVKARLVDELAARMVVTLKELATAQATEEEIKHAAGKIVHEAYAETMQGEPAPQKPQP